MLKKIILVSFLILNISYSSYAFDEQTLNDIELSKYGVTYQHDDLGKRLRRLENDFFGMSQSGNPDNRINNLMRISSQNNSQYFNYYPKTNSSEKKGKIKRFFDNVTSNFYSPSFTTGYTPSINDYGYSGSIYGNELMHMKNNFCPFDYNNGILNRYNYPHYGNGIHNNHFPHGNNNLSINNNFGNRMHANRSIVPYPVRYNNPYAYNPYNNSYPYIPQNRITNIGTHSSVHIMRD